MTKFEELTKQIEANANTGTLMPAYRCHKEVWALKIKEIVRETLPEFKSATCKGSYALGTACRRCERCAWERAHGPVMGTIIVPEGYFGPVLVTADFGHQPKEGGYLVFYKDGHRSFSPAEAFEDDHTRI